MATEKELVELLGRALADEAFRARLFDDPQRACWVAGFWTVLPGRAAESIK